MTEYRFRMALRSFLNRRPFRPFVIELQTGRIIRVNHPEAIQLRDGLVIFYTPDEDSTKPYLFDHDSVCILYEPDDDELNL